MKVTLIVRHHPEGYNYVPFDHDPSQEREAIVDGYIAALVREGHTVEHIPRFQHRPNGHPDDFIIKLVSGPRAA